MTDEHVDGTDADIEPTDAPPAPSDPPGASAPSDPVATGSEGSDAVQEPGAAAGPPAGDVLDRIPWYTVPALLIGVPALFALIGALSPWFADHVIWKYYWGPIFTDAARMGAQVQNGVIAEPGYNVVNTLSWAVLLAVCLLGITQLLNRIKQPANSKIILGATAWVVTGAVWHVLQDTRLISPPLEYFFITPPIYLLFGAFGIASWLVGVYMRWVADETGSNEAALQKAWFLFAAVVLGYTFIWVAKWDAFVHLVSPIWVAAAALITYLVLRWRVSKAGRIESTDALLIFPIGWMLVAFVFIADFQRDPWDTVGSNALPMGILWAPLLAGSIAALVYGAAASRADAKLGRNIVVAASAVFTATLMWATFDGFSPIGTLGFIGMFAVLGLLGMAGARWFGAGGRTQTALAFMAPINLVLIFSQMVDGFATSLGLDLAGYQEKHVLSAFLIDWFRETSIDAGFTFGATYPTFLAFAPVKLLISLLVVYAIDVSSAEDVKKYPTAIGLVKFAIIMVGIGPGVRDFVRLAMGV